MFSTAVLEQPVQATLEHNMCTAGRFAVPFRPHLFTKSKPALLHLTKTALAEDEVFLILVFIYCEARRQDRTVCLRLVNLLDC
jgi:hypothetical protein